MEENDIKFYKLAAMIITHFVACDAAADYVAKTTQIANSPEEAMATMEQYMKLDQARQQTRAEIEHFLKINI